MCVCLHRSLCVCVFVHIWVCTSASFSVCVCVCAYLGMYVCVILSVCVFVCAYLGMYVCVVLCVCVCAYLGMYVCVVLCVCVHVVREHTRPMAQWYCTPPSVVVPGAVLYPLSLPPSVVVPGAVDHPPSRRDGVHWRILGSRLVFLLQLRHRLGGIYIAPRFCSSDLNGEVSVLCCRQHVPTVYMYPRPGLPSRGQPEAIPCVGMYLTLFTPYKTA